MATKVAKKRLDYTPPTHLINKVCLDFNLEPSNTTVTSTMDVTRAGTGKDLTLDGEGLTLISVAVDDEPISNYTLTETQLTLHALPEQCQITIVSQCDPSANTSLEGLYVSDNAFCTQCEAEGFRKITYYLDRPDVLSSYTVTIVADESQYPFLLSNGNLVEKKRLPNGQHFVKWVDPFPKPSYLFALVAGDFDLLTDSFTTKSGREVTLELYVDKGKLDKGQHALDSLKRAMRWDEETFSLEYDLDVYMIVAVDFFNMGAMENKGLNVFNSKFVLADDKAATDEDFFNIESVIAHEYFHNWTGNRVTCRDWFQLSLKEGLTVFRDQLFSESFNSPLATRIKQVRVMREHQFAEDAGPMSHPIRPDEVVEMNNFYTVTVYDKGAEVIRMLWTMLGPDGFKQGMQLYFKRFDGQAVTCDDFVNAMQDANDVDLTTFKRWYSQSGTPQLNFEVTPSGELKVEQHTPPTADQHQKLALTMPLEIEVINRSGTTEQHQVTLSEPNQLFSIDAASDESTIIINSGFSAPVKINNDYSVAQLNDILQYASRPLDRWDAGQSLYNLAINAEEQGDNDTVKQVADNFAAFVADNKDNQELLAETLVAPSIEAIIAMRERVDIETLVSAHKNVNRAVARASMASLNTLLDKFQPQSNYQKSQTEIIRRRCFSTLLQLAAMGEDKASIIQAQFDQSDNMTDTLAALKAAQISNQSLFDTLMPEFEQQWQHDSLVLDKWFALHATCERDDILSRLMLLMEHKQFSLRNPNRIRSILGSFAFYNTAKLHQSDGSGYRFLCDQLMTIDPINPQVAARIVTPLLSWQKFDPARQEKMRFHLTRLLELPTLSNDLHEKLAKSLNM